MSVNSSSTSGVSPLPPQVFSSNSSRTLFLFDCFSSRVGNFIFTAFTVTNVLLLLPLSVAVLHLGCRRQRQRCSASASDWDYITYHMVVMEMICLLGGICYCIGVYADLLEMMMVGSHVFFITSCGQVFFHTLTCTECYLAVVHPITYLCLRNGGRLRIRNVIVWCIWLLGCAEMGIVALNTLDVILMVYFVQQLVSIAAVSFCSLSALRVLKQPGPGEGGGARESVDQSKQRAFYTIVAILGTLLLRFGGSLICNALYTSSHMSNSDRCVVIDSSFWFCLPSSLVLPLLFLHRAGKLPCSKHNNEPGRGSA